MKLFSPALKGGANHRYYIAPVVLVKCLKTETYTGRSLL
jgi:hypothetical protein